ncbi:GGDEF domain-containing protein [Rahnella sp. SAP-1]|jgi:diguanylate cyclase (GGDEF)-like protein|uniref:diguanylate cyclase n=1 Tax=Rouxiella aceris TaxID=2703884 RepID=A0A848MGZ2_9GAMM|nr:diguanylate cyclase [Rouxiella aceris]NMP27648.1 GGDEF domain-containing protein [Rouxiella aceris]
MTFHSYDELLRSKHRLSMLLFFFLNSASSLFIMNGPVTMANPVPGSSARTFPLVAIAIICITGLLLSFFSKKRHTRPLEICSITIGLLWAWHISLRFHSIGELDSGYLQISLLTIFFISAIALSDNFLAFCLHAAPSSIAVLFLDDFLHILQISFTIALPLIGLSLHQLMIRRSDAFTKKLVNNLYNEREKFSDLSMIDPLSGLYNRRGLQNKLQAIFSQGNSSNYVMLLDIDHFKAYNDNYGHSMGDQALVRVATAIRDAVRSRDIVVRYGGEEFLVLMANVNQEYAMHMAERIQRRVEGLEIPHHFNTDVSTHVTLSAGVALLHNTDFEAAVTSADSALYRAKSIGRNNIVYAWEPIACNS